MKRDPALIPDKLIKVAERAQAALEALPADERVAFIKKKPAYPLDPRSLICDTMGYDEEKPLCQS